MKEKKQFFVLISILLFIPLNYALFWRSTSLSTLAATALTVTAFIFFNKKNDSIFFLSGLLLGGLGESLVVLSGAWCYSKPLIFGIPLWLPIYWGISVMVIRRLELLFAARLKLDVQYPGKFNLKLLLFFVINYAVLIAIMSFFWRNSAITFILILSMVSMHIFKASKSEIFFALFIAVSGPMLEIFSIHLGIWNYGNPDIVKIPIWIFLGYAYFSIILRKFAISLSELFVKKA